MPGAAHPNPTVAQQADAFDAAFKAAGIPPELYDGWMDLWVKNPKRAHTLIARWVRGAAAPATSEPTAAAGGGATTANAAP